MNKQGILVVISGFSGAGKGTVVKEMLNRYDNYALSVSATTRKPREGEEEGIAYFFKSKEEFETMIADHSFIEYACYVDNYYGTPREYVEARLKEGKNVILEIELQGALHVREQYPDAVLIFITPPDAQELERRLIGRGTEAPDVVAKRMSRANEESGYMLNYDYIVVNDTVEDCAEEIHHIVQSEHDKAVRSQQLIEKIQRQLKTYAKGE